MQDRETEAFIRSLCDTDGVAWDGCIAALHRLRTSLTLDTD